MAMNVGFIGAGGRATGAHYPAVTRLEQEGVVKLQAICDLNEARLNDAGGRFGVERRYTDYHRMLEEVDLDALYVIMPPQYSLPIIVDCLNAGMHVLVEKPPAMSAGDMEIMVEAAERNKRVTAVCFQRRIAPVAQEVRRLILERGPVTMCIGEFHKNMLKSKGPSLGVSTLLDDLIHAVDFVRYMCGGEPIVSAQTFTVKAGPDSEHLETRGTVKVTNDTGWKMQWMKGDDTVQLKDGDTVVQILNEGQAHDAKVFDAFVLAAP